MASAIARRSWLGCRASDSGRLWEARWRLPDGSQASRTGFSSAEAAAKFYDAQVLAIDRNACVRLLYTGSADGKWHSVH
jgi:hypothetical protein